MSGVEPLVVLGAVCNALQLAETALKFVAVYNNVRDNHKPDPDLSKYCKDAEKLYKDILKDVPSNPVPPNAQEPEERQERQHVAAAAKDVIDAIKKLTDKIPKLDKPPSASMPCMKQAKIMLVIRFLWRKRDIEALEKNLDRCIALANSRMNRLAATKDKALRKQIIDSIQRLDEAQRNALVAHKTQNDAIRELISAALQQMEERISRTQAVFGEQLGQQRVVLKDINHRMEKSDENARYEKILKSLRYGKMGVRYQQIHECYPQTYEWALRDASGCQRNGASGTVDSSPFELVSWLRSDSPQFWITGKPGAGKSSLMKHIVRSPKTTEYLKVWNQKVFILHNFIWKAGEEIEHSLSGLMCSLLHQILHMHRSVYDFLKSTQGQEIVQQPLMSDHQWLPRTLKSITAQLALTRESWAEHDDVGKLFHFIARYENSTEEMQPLSTDLREVLRAWYHRGLLFGRFCEYPKYPSPLPKALENQYSAEWLICAIRWFPRLAKQLIEEMQAESLIESLQFIFFHALTVLPFCKSLATARHTMSQLVALRNTQVFLDKKEECNRVLNLAVSYVLRDSVNRIDPMKDGHSVDLLWRYQQDAAEVIRMLTPSELPFNHRDRSFMMTLILDVDHFHLQWATNGFSDLPRHNYKFVFITCNDASTLR